MNIQLNSEQIESAIDSHINKAVEDALKHYSVQESIAESITKDIASGVIGTALHRALKSVDADTLTARLATEIEKAMTGAVVRLLHEGLAHTLLKLRGINDYASNYQAERARILAELQRS